MSVDKHWRIKLYVPLSPYDADKVANSTLDNDEDTKGRMGGSVGVSGEGFTVPAQIKLASGATLQAQKHGVSTATAIERQGTGVWNL